MQTSAIEFDPKLHESRQLFDCKARNVLLKACLECVAMAGLLLVAIFTTLIFGL